MNRTLIGGLATGFGAGLLTGYLIPTSMSKPTISIVSNTWTYSGFPPNTALMSMGGGTGGVGSAPTNIGTTDANGNLVITGVPAIPANTTILYVVFVAGEPSIFATVIVKS